MKFMRFDSPFMMGLAKITDLILINVYTTLLCIPVITGGAAITALHHMSLKIVRNEQSGVTKEYFASFKRNFKQATLIWLIVLLAIVLLVGDLLIISFSGLPFTKLLKILFLVVTFILAFIYMFIFPVLARFDNTIKNTIKNSILIGILHFPKTILMMVVGAIPILVLSFPQLLRLLPVVLLFGFSGPSWVSAKLYNKYFKTLEDQVIAQEMEALADDDECIFKDELDPELVENEVQ